MLTFIWHWPIKAEELEKHTGNIELVCSIELWL